MDDYIFTHFKNTGGYKAEIPGRLLNVARTTPVSIPLEDGGRVCLTTSQWYDQNSISGHEGGVFDDMSKVSEFDNSAIYRVCYIATQVKTKYMFAIKLAS